MLTNSKHVLPEWYADFGILKPLLQQHLQYTDSCLLLLASASALHHQLYDSGYRGITVAHSSSELVHSWRQAHDAHQQPTLIYQVADITEGLAFEHCPYNVIIDKGMLDTSLCKEQGAAGVEAALQNIWNNLKGPGTFIWLTHGPPTLRSPLLGRLPWASVTAHAVVPVAEHSLTQAPSRSAAEAMQTMSDTLVEASDTVADAGAYAYICKKPYV